jgi:hypothetical protein
VWALVIVLLVAPLEFLALRALAHVFFQDNCDTWECGDVAGLIFVAAIFLLPVAGLWAWAAVTKED